MKKIIFTICFLCCFITQNKSLQLQFLSLEPDTIITNNNTINYYNLIEKHNNEISEDNYNFTYKKEEILNNINEFKNIYINTINEYINNNEYQLALNYLNKFFYLFSGDLQVIALKNYLLSFTNKQNLIEYTDEIEILSFNPLISYPKLVLNEKNSSAIKIDENNITTDEFKKILLSLYNNNYILISSKLLIDNTKLMIPSNKKPLILILEDVEYNTKTSGSVEKLILDNNGNIATYTPKRSINDRIERNNDFITILEEFTLAHPSFSLNNAKATIVVDGSKGIFGYNTEKSNATSKYQIKKAMEIINYLKNNGYTFISEGYKNYFNEPYISFASGLNSWKNNVEPILGESSNIYFLNSTIDNNDEIKDKLELLSSYSYSVIIGSEMTSKSQILNNIRYVTAKQINGKTLRFCQDSLYHLFDCEYVYDHLNRHITYKI